MRKIKLGILISFIIVVFLIFITIFNSPVKDDKLITIEKNSQAKEIAQNLFDNNIIYSKELFLIYLKITKKDKDIIPGEFMIPKGRSFFGIADYITNSKNIYSYKITLIEGQTIKKFLKIINDDPNLVGEVYSVKEGTMMPDTYYFVKGNTKQSIIRRATDSMNQYLDELWVNRKSNLPYKTKQEALILASMVEKETRIPSERELIAGLFINRLKIGMKLQSDPTVAYGLGRETADKLTKKDLVTDHPYNTYTRYGLPVGPIDNPSRESLRSVFFPAKTKYLYFVANNKGGHFFTTNLKDHNKEVAKWREIEKNIRKNKNTKDN